MPSIAISDSVPSEATMKEEKKKSKSKTVAETPEIDESSIKKTKKKKSKEVSDSDGEKEKKSKKKDKKRKASEAENEDGRSDTSSERGEPVNLKAKKKKAKLEEPEEKEDPNALSKFRISGPLKAKLEANGIKSLFPIQAMTFDTVLDGADLVGRARTGQGKTLAFVLPIIESLTNGPGKSQRKTGFRRPPSVLVLLPTRELANQVYADFETYGGSLGLSSCCLYGGGGASIPGQQIKLNKGIDIVIGTPGRVKDHLERGNLNLGSLVFRVLDEADEMLNMGFVDDVEHILGKVDDTSKVQTLLFSATLPSWVKNIASRFLKADKKTVDIVGNEKMKASTSVRHIVLPCSYQARPTVIPDVISCYGSGGRTIIFTETKADATELTGVLAGARELHGDIQQSKREATLAAFRSGKFMTLVATDVAARGLDINDVQLIIQCEPPRDIESYIHRSGRTGRAGNTGVAVMLYDPRKSGVERIQKETGVKFEHVSAPQPADIAKSAGLSAVETIAQVSDSVIPTFKSAAEELLNKSGQSAVDLLAKAIAKAVGYTEMKTRSLLTSMENYATLHLESGRPIFTPSFAFSMMRRYFPEEKINGIQGLTLTADGKGAVFDVPSADLDLFLSGQEKEAGVSIQSLTSLPPLQEREQSRGRFGGRGGGRFSSGRGGRGGGGGYSDRRYSGGGGGGGRGGGGYKRW